MLNNELMFSSRSDEWETPLEIFNDLDRVFYFTLDPCSTDDNHKCDKYYTMEDDGLSKSWKGERVFVNPPYGGAIKHWARKCYEESSHADIVMLMPARTDTIYQHKYIFEAKAICFIKGRLKFMNRMLSPDSDSKTTSAPFPSQFVVFANIITREQEEVLRFYGKLLYL